MYAKQAVSISMDIPPTAFARELAPTLFPQFGVATRSKDEAQREELFAEELVQPSRHDATFAYALSRLAPCKSSREEMIFDL